MKKNLLILLFVLFIVSCKEKIDKENFTLTGKITDTQYNNTFVYLNEMKKDLSGFTTLDSAKVENNIFSFKGIAGGNPEVRVISLSKNIKSPSAVFLLQEGNIEITFEDRPKVKGTPLNDDYQALMSRVEEINKKMEATKKEYASKESEGKLTPEIQDQLYTQFMEFGKEIGSEHFEYLKKIINTPAGETFLSAWGANNYFDETQLHDLLALVKPEAKSNPVIMSLEEKNQTAMVTAVGSSYTDVKGNTFDGKMIALSDYIGKNEVVLIDFWASWCGPCIQEMPNVVAAYSKYKGKGFEIVGISLDEKKEAWTGAISRMKMTWPQMSDLKGWSSELSAPYKINSIPMTLLVDKNGKIIAKNLRGKELDKKLAEILK